MSNNCDCEQKKIGHVIVLSGPSGVGKGTVCRELMKKFPNIIHSVSATTRSPRAGETEGVNYFFVTPEKFEQMLKEDAFLENFEIYGNRYGTPRQFVVDQTLAGRDVILEIDTQGALRIKTIMPESKLIFLMPPKEEELLNRLNKRNSETAESLKRRYDCARAELEMRSQYDYCVVNDKLEDCVAEVSKILDQLSK